MWCHVAGIAIFFACAGCGGGGGGDSAGASAPPSSGTGTATLEWSANSESDLADYWIYRGSASGAYGTPIATVPAGVSTYTVAGLQNGIVHYFVVSAYEIAGNEGPRSDEVSKAVP